MPPGAEMLRPPPVAGADKTALPLVEPSNCSWIPLANSNVCVWPAGPANVLWPRTKLSVVGVAPVPIAVYIFHASRVAPDPYSSKASRIAGLAQFALPVDWHVLWI